MSIHTGNLRIMFAQQWLMDRVDDNEKYVAGGGCSIESRCAHLQHTHHAAQDIIELFTRTKLWQVDISGKFVVL